jgi:hypothetical protein
LIPWNHFKTLREDQALKILVGSLLLVVVSASSVGADCSAWVLWRREMLKAANAPGGVLPTNFGPMWIYKEKAVCERKKQEFIDGGKWVRTQPGRENDNLMEFLCLPVLQEPPRS